MRDFRKTDFFLSSVPHQLSLEDNWWGKLERKKSVFLKLRTNHWSKALAVKTTFFTLYLSNLNPEGEVSSLKIDRFIANYVSNLKWAWQAQFLSRILVIWKNDVFFEDK